MRLCTMLTGFALAATSSGCGGSGTVTSTGTSVPATTATEQAADARQLGAYQEAEDLCRSLPVREIAQATGQGGTDQEVAAAMASNVRADLRDATRRGCLAGLERN